jgi:hypothetical protein
MILRRHDTPELAALLHHHHPPPPPSQPRAATWSTVYLPCLTHCHRPRTPAMPMYRDPDRQCGIVQPSSIAAVLPPLGRQLSEESIRTEFCDGPLLDDNDARVRMDLRQDHVEEQERLSEPTSGLSSENRQQLIHRLKRDQGPTPTTARKVSRFAFAGTTIMLSHSRLAEAARTQVLCFHLLLVQLRLQRIAMNQTRDCRIASLTVS